MTPPDPPSQPSERSVLPTVARPRSGPSALLIVAGAVIAAVVLFVVLDARRRSLTAPAVSVSASERYTSDALPTLYIPPDVEASIHAQPTIPIPPQPLATAAPPRTYPVVPPPASSVAQPPSVPYVPTSAPQRPARTSGGSTLVIDNGAVQSGAAPSSPVAGISGGDATSTAARARAGIIANRSTTVAQGTLIAAILETAFNSSRAGFARALVQRDVRGFDGARVLIPRGTRLIGEYRSDAAPGQNRALVNWTRLIRPDGVTIAIGSPATDTVGTGGVRAEVDNHFFQRFAGAILQSALDIGVNLAARSADNAVIVALPGTLQGGNVATRPTQIPPTLSVRQGTSISVFVARDLDFTEVEEPR